MKKERPNFRIIENYEPDIDLEEFKKDYLDENTNIDEMCRKYDISRKKFYDIKKQALDGMGVKIKPNRGRYACCSNERRHIYKANNHYRVSKVIDSRVIYFGQYSSLDTAIKVRDLLIEHDWDYDYYFEVIRPQFGGALDFGIPKGFEEDYLDGMTVNELREKYNMSLYQYYNISTMIKQKLGLHRKPMRGKV